MLLRPGGTSSLEGEETQVHNPSLTPGTSPYVPQRRFPLRLVHLPAILADRIRGSSIQPPAAASATSASIPPSAAMSKLPKTSTDSEGVVPPIARMSVVVRMPAPPLLKTTVKAPPKPLSIPTPSGVLSITPPKPMDPSEELPYVEFGIVDVRMRGFEDSDFAGEGIP